MLEWNAHDYSKEEELRRIMSDLERIRDSKDHSLRHKGRSGNSRDATWQISLKEARDNQHREGFFLELYSEWIANNPCHIRRLRLERP